MSSVFLLNEKEPNYMKMLITLAKNQGLTEILNLDTKKMLILPKNCYTVDLLNGVVYNRVSIL